MNAAEVRPGLRVLTKDVATRSGILAGTRFLDARKDGVVGPTTGPVRNHDGAWWVRDEKTGAVAPYWFHELSVAEQLPDDDWRGGVPR